MASHVVVIDTGARRATIKTTPGKHLTDVLQEACSKWGLNAEQYILKHNKKIVDLSLTLRLANLPPGAQLELVQASRSPSVITVALQLPESENSTRLTHKFPSNTSFWQILRVFESGQSTITNVPRNLIITQRGVPEMGQGGSGRLNYEIPVLHFMGRELSTFTDLQKTLGQMGFNTGNVLLRLSFRNSGKPLEEAMQEISLYFKEADEPEPTLSGAHAGSVGTFQSEAAPMSMSIDADVPSLPSPDDTPMEDPTAPSTSSKEEAPIAPLTVFAKESPASAPQASEPTPDNTVLSEQNPETISTPIVESTSPLPTLNHAFRIFSPSSDTVPLAARTAFNDADYEFTIDHAKQYQAHLAQESRNRRLKSDAELAAQERAKADKLSAIKTVTIRVRLPDQYQIEADFTQDDTTAALYRFVRYVLEKPDEGFVLRYTGPKGGQLVLKDGGEKLVKDLGFVGRALVVFAWDDAVILSVRKQPILKSQWRDKAEEIKVDLGMREAESSKGNECAKTVGEGKQDKGKAKVQLSHAEKESKLKSLLGKFSKK
ncbi:putative UBX domain protein [Patellaria atrata CBS 101060]|uniref:UBX domain protein n=1 Tax=Patellaria atrata CBS 101060 TaxID=1346257 RepID=A0A9P4SIC6_9PEZI|nr:putative UBX domain protein [Patellaria atrata CBS 101060]